MLLKRVVQRNDVLRIQEDESVFAVQVGMSPQIVGEGVNVSILDLLKPFVLAFLL